MKRVFSILLVLLLVASLMPVQAMAETTGAHSITVNVEGSGTASANFQTANAGDTVTINWEPESGYELKTITGSSSAGSVEIDPYRYDFTMPNGDVTVTVKFGLIGDGDDEYEGGSSAYVVCVYVLGGVTLHDEIVSVSPGSSYQFVPHGNYEIDRVEAMDGRTQAPVNVSNSWRVEVPANGLAAYIYLKEGGSSGTGGNEGGNGGSTPQPTEYNITVNTPDNGIVSGVPAKAKKGDEITVTTTPAEGYELDKITVTCNGNPVTVTDGKFTMPEGEVTVTVTFKAKQVLPSGLSFSYAYDVYRSPAFPKKNGTFKVYNFNKPLDKNGNRIDNAGIWTLSAMGKYSSLTGSYPGLSDVVTGVASAYGVSANDLPIHKLTLNGEFVTYGVLVMHDASEPVAFFIGSNWDGGSGYLFCNTVYQYDDEKTFNVKEDVTDEVTGGNEPSAEHTTNPNSNAFKANIDLTDQAVVDMLVTPDDLAKGKNVRVYMEVKEMTTSAVPSSDKTAIINKAGSKKIAAFVDIQLLKQIGTDTPTPIHNTGSNAVPITLKLTNAVIPSGAGKDSFSIIYHHVENGTTVTEEIPATFDVSSKTLTFKASKFSTYALVVKPAGTLDKVVKSGDIAGINDMTMLLLCCAAVLAGVAVYDKKRAR